LGFDDRTNGEISSFSVSITITWDGGR